MEELMRGIILLLIMAILPAYSTDYNSVKSVVFDAENALEKTVKFNGKIYKISISSDWNHRKRATILVTSLENRRGAIWYIFFNKSFKERIKKLERNQLITIDCRIKRIGIGIQCDLIDFSILDD